jgi:hypothetical protein
MSSNLSHRKSQLVTYNQLAMLPAPQALGRNHKPVPHHQLVDAIRLEVDRRGLCIDREQFALGRHGSALFGVIDLTPVSRNGATSWQSDPQRSTALGFRNATDQSLSIRGVAGSHVFICDNMAMSGDTFAFQRKNSRYLDLAYAIAMGFDRFVTQAQQFNVEVARMQARELTDMAAKAIMFDVFSAGIAPLHLFDDVDRNYFKPEAGWTDCEPRTLWGVHGAFTRAFRELSPQRVLGASTALGKALAGVQ